MEKAIVESRVIAHLAEGEDVIFLQQKVEKVTLVSRVMFILQKWRTTLFSSRSRRKQAHFVVALFGLELCTY